MTDAEWLTMMSSKTGLSEAVIAEEMRKQREREAEEQPEQAEPAR